MAVTAGNWYVLAFQPLAHASWASPPTLPSPLAAAVRNGTDLICYCTDDSSDITLAFEGGEATIPAATVSSETLKTSRTDSRSGATMSTYVKAAGGGNTWYCYDSAIGFFKMSNCDDLGAALSIFS